MNKEQPLFLIPPEDEIVKDWKPAFQKLEQSSDQLVFTVNPAIIAGKEVASFQQMLMALQHYPHLIERMIFSVNFKFMLVDDVPVEVSEDEWKMRPEVYLWFHEMLNLPISMFFIADGDARSYCLFGDVLALGNFKQEQDAGGQTGLEFSMEQMQLMADRLINGSWALLMYCHATGFNPDKYIDALLADYDMPFTAADVRSKYEKDIEGGIKFRMVPKT